MRQFGTWTWYRGLVRMVSPPNTWARARGDVENDVKTFTCTSNLSWKICIYLIYFPFLLFRFIGSYLLTSGENKLNITLSSWPLA